MSQAGLLDQSGSDVTTRFKSGIVDSSADASWIYLIGRGGATGRVSTADGSLDPEWGVTTPSPFDSGWPRQIAQLADWYGLTDVEVDAKGRVLQSGWIGNGSGSGVPTTRHFLTRTLSDGKPDPNFAANGIKMMKGLGSGSPISFSGRLGLDSKSRIYESIESVTQPTRTRRPMTKFTIVRLRSSGEADPSYGKNGTAVLAVDRTPTQQMRLVDMAVSKNGRAAVLMAVPGQGLQIRAFDQKGRPDVRFNRATRRVRMSGNHAKPVSVDFDRSGDLTVVMAKRGSSPRVRVDRVKADGSPRGTFGNGGRLWITDSWLRKNYGAGSPSLSANAGMATGVSVDNRRRVILTVSGQVGKSSSDPSAISIRLDSAGGADTGFTTGGFLLGHSPLTSVLGTLPIATLPTGAAILSSGTKVPPSDGNRSIVLYDVG